MSQSRHAKKSASFSNLKFQIQVLCTKNVTVRIMVAVWLSCASNRKVANPWFDYRCGRASLCPWERYLMLFPHFWSKQSTRCGGPAWRKTCKQNSFWIGVVWQTWSIQLLVQTKKKMVEQ